MNIHFTILSEKIVAKGEDAPPSLLFGDDNTGLLAVYDGLGGAGSQIYTIIEEDTEKQYSGAYLAAHLAKQITENFYTQAEIDAAFAQNLEFVLKESFGDYLQKLGEKPSLLKSKLIKKLPTTLAGIVYQLHTKKITINAFWAGDSRCYFLNEKGLVQVTEDDLKGNPDALENLLQDATISNCVHAGENFSLQSLQIRLNKPLILLAATDGCFAYLPSPAHLEYILLKTLMESYYDIEDWREKLSEELSEKTADDLSLSLVAFGFANLNDLKSKLYTRFQKVYKKYIAPFEKTKLPEEEYKNLLQKLWEDYKKGYYL